METPLAVLQRYWGYNSFRPLQERIIASLLGGRDTCVVMPTGGGKSLCYQVPALVSGKTTVVISPLIALMQDQVAQLKQMGISAALLNSSLSNVVQSQTMRGAQDGAFRLLYLSPERLAREDTVAWLRRVPVSCFAIDEAHCISEWGHEFRPEYRQLNTLRTNFPERPIAAFTASATQRVRHDILQQLQLRDPDKYIASFHRPNLHYVVRLCDEWEQRQLLVRALRHYREGNVIIYAPTIVRVEGTVDFLNEAGIPSVPYHGRMESDERRRNQERWMSDEVRVLVGTIAFGLGINKASVRAVIHLSLPKSVEQYYQEAGRAGRDGHPADCVLLWQLRDAGLLAHFNEQIVDPAERSRAWQRYEIIRGFAESKQCRHRQICLHFGEMPKWGQCGICDSCGYQPPWLAAPAWEQQPRRRKRKRERALESVSQPKQSVSSLQPAQEASLQAGGDVDHELREYLKEWRRATAKEQGIAAFIVMHDTSLDDLCRVKPRSASELRSVMGFGVRKVELYGAQILKALERFRNGARAKAVAVQTLSPAEETKKLLGEGCSLEEIARRRGRQLSTVVGTIAVMVEAGDLEFRPEWVAPEKLAAILEACARLGTQWLKPLKAALPDQISFEEIRLVVAQLRREAKKADNKPAMV